VKHSLKYDVKVLKIKLDSPGYTVLDIKIGRAHV